MRCFNHADREAVGSCKYCSKGLCPDCCADLAVGLACSGKHERLIEQLDAMVARAGQVQSTAARAKLIAPAFYLLMGLVFGGYGIFYGRSGLFLIVLGSGFTLFGAALLVMNLRAYRRPPNA
jgi:hypothetical protein